MFVKLLEQMENRIWAANPDLTYILLVTIGRYGQ